MFVDPLCRMLLGLVVFRRKNPGRTLFVEGLDGQGGMAMASSFQRKRHDETRKACPSEKKNIIFAHWVGQGSHMYAICQICTFRHVPWWPLSFILGVPRASRLSFFEARSCAAGWWVGRWAVLEGWCWGCNGDDCTHHVLVSQGKSLKSYPLVGKGYDEWPNNKRL